MSVLDRINRKQAETGTGNSSQTPGSTIQLADELQVTKRLRILFAQLSSLAAIDKQSWILQTVLDEVIEEINDRTSDDRETADALLSMWFGKCALMMEWVATGNIPDGLQDDEFTGKILTAKALEAAGA